MPSTIKNKYALRTGQLSSGQFQSTVDDVWIVELDMQTSKAEVERLFLASFAPAFVLGNSTSNANGFEYRLQNCSASNVGFNFSLIWSVTLTWRAEIPDPEIIISKRTQITTKPPEDGFFVTDYTGTFPANQRGRSKLRFVPDTGSTRTFITNSTGQIMDTKGEYEQRTYLDIWTFSFVRTTIDTDLRALGGRINENPVTITFKGQTWLYPKYCLLCEPAEYQEVVINGVKWVNTTVTMVGNLKTWLWVFLDQGYERLAEVGDTDNLGNNITQVPTNRTSRQPILNRERNTTKLALLNGDGQLLSEEAGVRPVTPAWRDFELAPNFSVVPLQAIITN